MTTPERSPSEERKTRLRVEFTELMRRFILERIVDPNNGTDFTLIQSEMGPPFEPIESIAMRGRHVLTAGVPNPDLYDFNYMTMTDEERVQFDQGRAKFLENFRNYFGTPEKGDEDQS